MDGIITFLVLLNNRHVLIDRWLKNWLSLTLDFSLLETEGNWVDHPFSWDFESSTVVGIEVLVDLM